MRMKTIKSSLKTKRRKVRGQARVDMDNLTRMIRMEKKCPHREIRGFRKQKHIPERKLASSEMRMPSIISLKGPSPTLRRCRLQMPPRRICKISLGRCIPRSPPIMIRRGMRKRRLSQLRPVNQLTRKAK